MTQPIAPMGKNRIGMRKSMTKLYSLQEAEELYAAWEKKDYLCASIAKQLADTMRENIFLRDTLTIIDMQAMNVMQDDVPPYGAILRCGWVHEKCKEALNWNKDSDS